ncbi:MAG: hypothetical protein QOE33_856 [Acidobacteriota bacterium]|nr:hypothetical protein [Acidobacteriota bacterium]
MLEVLTGLIVLLPLVSVGLLLTATSDAPTVLVALFYFHPVRERDLVFTANLCLANIVCFI